MDLRLQFKLRTLLLVVTLSAIMFGGYARRYHRRRAPKPAPIKYRDRVDKNDLLSGSQDSRAAADPGNAQEWTIVGNWAATLPSQAIGGRTRFLLQVGPADSFSGVSTIVSFKGRGGTMHSAFSAATDKRRKSIRFEAQGGFKEQYGLAAEGAGELVALDRLDFHGRFVVFETLIVVDAELKRVSGDWNVLDEESDPR